MNYNKAIKTLKSLVEQFGDDEDKSALDTIINTSERQINDLAHELYPIYTAGPERSISETVDLAIEVIKENERLKMDENELINFLKENLTISLSSEQSFDNSKSLRVGLNLNEKEFTSDRISC